jgi:nitrite reductase/ring-hydroxylating ferredoxin subunit
MSKLASSNDVVEGSITAVKDGKSKICLTRVDGKVCAFINKCPHLGLPLDKGRVEDGKVRCPFHGSSFDLATGENTDWCSGVASFDTPKWMHGLVALGKKPAPLEILNVVEAEGNIILE